MAPTSEEVWRILGELAEAQKETERRFRETEQRFQAMDQRLDQLFREAECLVQPQNQSLSDPLGKWGNGVGEFVQWRVQPAMANLFQNFGITIHEFYPETSVRRGDECLDIDLLVANATEVILVAAKSKLTQTDVDEHLERLSKFKRLMPRYGDVRAMGAVAGMVVPDDVARYAYRQGLFVMAQSGESVVILNDDTFQPRRW